MIYQNQKLPQVLSIKQLYIQICRQSPLEVLCRISFFIAYRSYGFGFPKLMGMLIDSVKSSDANNIALMLIGILLCNPFFPFLDYPYRFYRTHFS
jgi:hypothetical protein